GDRAKRGGGGMQKIRSSARQAIVRIAFRAQRSKPPPPPLARCARSGGPPPPLCASRFAGEDKRAFSIIEERVDQNASRASVPIPKFVSLCGTPVCELRNRRTLATH